MLYLQILLLLILVIPFGPCLGFDYCNNENEFCKPDKNFVCDLEQVPVFNELVGLYPMTTKLVRQILHLHNDLRSRVARGGVKVGALVFPEADYMPEVIWDNELEYVASEHAKRCHMKHDKCRSGPRYNFAGQNLAWKAQDTMMTAMYAINNSMELFEKESEEFLDPAQIDQLSGSVHKTGHFTVIINDQVTRVGCGVAKCKDCERKMYKHCNHLSCNYDFTNMNGVRIYVRKNGPNPGSSEKCTSVDDYPGLCKNDGKLRKKVTFQKYKKTGR